MELVSVRIEGFRNIEKNSLVFGDGITSLVSTNSYGKSNLMKAIDSLTNNKTVIMIAHRLKTVKNCDNIFVINEGKIVQSGTHDELIKEDGIYKSFVTERKEAVGWKI